MTIRPRHSCALLAVVAVTLIASNVESFPQNNSSQINWKPLYFFQNWISNNYNEESGKYGRINVNDSVSEGRKFIFPENGNPIPPVIVDRNGIPDNLKNGNANDSYKILTGLQPSRVNQLFQVGVEQSDIVFPGPKSGDDIEKVLKVDGDPNCNDGKTYCVNSVNNYPTKYIEDVLRNSADNYQAFFGKDEIYDIEIGQRIDVSKEFTLCTSIEQVIYPKSALNKDNKWMYIVNQPKFQQGVRIETCQSENSACNKEIDIPNRYETTCKQKYIFRKLLAVNDNGDTIPDLFKLPSCCSCVFREIEGGLAARFGSSSSRQSPVPKNKNKR